MQRTTIVAPAELLKRLRRMAAERGSSMAGLIREALEEKARSDRPRPRSLGLGRRAMLIPRTAQATSELCRALGADPRYWAAERIARS